ncbi:kelch repeat-containing protein [uncultured Chitinophaga sp.]|uniref:kelch repeat-containing protein n=1 Tax=uncultured Chitinophaga sp. TaxID=339340 RepID=UPI0025FF51CB|nr:kelch repeat-containing protein [uncultured Chitinophaga sp.]
MKIELRNALYIARILLLLLCPAAVTAQSHGLIFSSFEAVQEKRTSLDLGAGSPVCVFGEMDLSFELSFLPDRLTYFGYIFRLINNKGENIDLVYSADGFNLIVGDARTNIRFSIPKETLERRWNKFRLRYNEGELSFWVDEKLINKTVAKIGDNCFQVVFGACNLQSFRSTDLPPMELRNIGLREDGKLKHFWPLGESEGNVCVDSIKGAKGSVTNPTWVKFLHLHWQLAGTYNVNGLSSVAFDADQEMLYIVASDSVHRYAVRNTLKTALPQLAASHHLIKGNISFYHPAQKQLYNLFTDTRSITSFDTAQHRWRQPADSADVTEYWHQNKFYHERSGVLYTLGGYGQLKYKNQVRKYDFAKHEWSDVKVTGDLFTPRYLAALGTTTGGDSAYIIGGYGSNSGDQIVNPKYLYDLLLFDVQQQSFKKIYTLPAPKEHFLFANALIPEGDNYYALTFPNDRFDSRLQLIKGSLLKPGYILVGDTIPYSFQDTRSYADLFYCKASRQLLAVTQLAEINGTSTVKLYTIAFPPNEQEVVVAEGNKGLVFLLMGGLLAAACVLAVYIWRRPKKKVPPAAVAHPLTPLPEMPAPVVTEDVEVPQLAAINLFGNFTVTDAEGQDVTRLFTPLLKEMFLLITIYTFRERHGISVEQMNDILWTGMPDKAAKNNRSVNMAKLKAILEKLGNCGFKKEGDKWMFHYEKTETTVDLADFTQLLENRQTMDRVKIIRLTQLLKKGPFLHQTEYNWLDDIKSDVSGKAMDVLVHAGSLLTSPKDAELLIEIANSLFIFDQVNEQALRLKCKNLIALGRHSLAKNTYEKFAREYKHLYAEDFPESYNDIING